MPVSSTFIPWLVAVSIAAAPVVPPLAEPPRSSLAPLAAPSADHSDNPTFARAVGHYLAGRLLEALDDYQHLLVTTGEPVCLANIGRVYAERGNPELAAEYYRKFLVHPRAVEAQKVDVRARLLALAPAVPVPVPMPDPPRGEPTPAKTPEGPLLAPPTVDRTPRVLTGTGGALLAVGVPAVVVGSVLAWRSHELLVAVAEDLDEQADRREGEHDEAIRKQTIAISLLVCGGLALVAGVVVMGVGGRRAARIQRERRVGARAGGLVFNF